MKLQEAQPKDPEAVRSATIFGPFSTDNFDILSRL